MGDDDIVSCASPPCPSYSPVPVPPTYTPDAFSPPASPPRQRHSPLLLVQSFESPEYRPPSPSYSQPHHQGRGTRRCFWSSHLSLQNTVPLLQAILRLTTKAEALAVAFGPVI